MKRLFYLLMLASCVLSSAAALAEPDEAAKLVARELMAQGRAQRENRDYEAALVSFSKAHAIMHVPTTLLEAARARVDTGKWLEALELLRELSTMPPRVDEPAPFAHARDEALQLGRDLETRLPTLRLDLSGAPQGSPPSVTVDGVARPDCVNGCRVDPGPHVVTARTPRTVAEEQLHLAEKEQQTLELVFSPLETPPPVAARDGASASRSRDQHDGAQRVPLASWISGGVALAGLTAGTVLGVSAVSERDDLRRSCAPSCSSGDLARVRREVVLANVAFGVGITAAAVAVVTYVVARRAPGRAGARRLNFGAAPDAQARGAYLALDGQF